MAKLTTDDLKKHLEAYEREELVKIITDLAQMSKKARKHLSAEVKAEEATHSLYEESKQTITGYVSPDADAFKPRLSKAKRTIDDFRKSTGNKALTVDLMLHFVEAGTEFAVTHSDLEEKFYSKLVTMYSNAVEECENDELLFHQFNERLHKILEAAAPIENDYPAILTDRYHSISWVEDQEQGITIQ
ncbi:DUF6155 family protein [Planomicrobium sp. CPCC 101110]|uniref:DUF6155 family protein n=1 Tax=Planomicrobium sp. CPCC 101110 TaxID=2599619 RepID=UPI0011B3E531|nr:DUF6155 family protein [Planomicrobium sp. CPCC 101110]TWT25207.1 hypothetical protein FQV30_12615 [Planomicrobium sp. CPCC 101110]